MEPVSSDVTPDVSEGCGYVGAWWVRGRRVDEQ